MDKGFIKLDRKLLTWRWMTEPNTLAVWVWLLLNANWEDRGFKDVTLKRGSLATSYKSIGDGTGLTPRQARTAVEHLKNTEEVSVKQHSKFLEISIKNYDVYQGGVSQMSGKRQADVSQMSPTKEIKELKNNNKYIYARARGELGNVFLTDDEVEELKAYYPTAYEKLINDVGLYKAKSGTDYASDYAACISFAINQGVEKAQPDLGYEITTEFDFVRDEDGYEVARPKQIKVYKDGTKETMS